MRVTSLGFRNWGLGAGFGVWGLKFRVEGLGFEVKGLGLRVEGSTYHARCKTRRHGGGSLIIDIFYWHTSIPGDT